MITCERLTKVYRGVSRVEDVSFEAGPGHVVGIVGPNGAGKSTTLRMLLGLTRPTRGIATIDGRPYRDLTDPLRTVGAALDEVGIELALSPLRLLRAHARSNRLPVGEVAEVLAATGLSSVAERPVREFSLGMRKRVGLALALLGRPNHLIVDEPLNGLDPPSIVWLRGLLRRRAEDGCAVLVASHLLAEQERLCDRVVVMDSGRVAGQGATADLVRTHAPMRTRVEVAPGDTAALAEVLQGLPVLARTSTDHPGAWLTGDQRDAVSARLLTGRIAVRDLTVVSSGLEGVFERLVSERQEFGVSTESIGERPPERAVAGAASRSGSAPRRAA